jgi:hypothetical protein
MNTLNINRAEWLFFISMPLLIFPVLVFVATIIDWLAGNSELILKSLYGSKSSLLRELVSDWIASLPFSLIIAWLTFLPIYIVFQYFIDKKSTQALLAGLLVGIIHGVLLYHFDMTANLIIVLTMSLLSIFLIFLQKIFVR